MAICRFALVLGLVFLVQSSRSAPTLSTTKPLYHLDVTIVNRFEYDVRIITTHPDPTHKLFTIPVGGRHEIKTTSSESTPIFITAYNGTLVLRIDDKNSVSVSPSLTPVSRVFYVPSGPEINADEKSTSSALTETTSKTELITNSQSGDESSSVPPTTAKQNATEGSLKNVTASSNFTNATVVEEEDGPSSILYPVCSGYLGVHNKKIIKDEQMSASSTLDAADLMKLINATLEELQNNSTTNSTQIKSNYTITGNMTAAHDGRLLNTKGSWCGSGDSSVAVHHLVVDLGEVSILEGVITQGRADSDNWVTTYTVEYSSNKKEWLSVKKDGQQMVFKGNKDRDSLAVGSFPHRIAARYIKFTPMSFHGELMCMRVEAIGCHPDTVNVAKNQPIQQSSSELNSTSPKAVDGKMDSEFFNETCTRTRTQSSPWLRIDLRRTYKVKEIFISNQDHARGWDMWNFEVRVGKSLDNEGNNNTLCSPLYSLLPGLIGAVVCKNGTVGRYVNIRIPRDDTQLSLCEVTVIGVAETVVKLGLEDIANSLQTGAVTGESDGGGDFVGGLLGQLQSQLGGQLGGALLGQGMGMLNNLKGQGMGMLNNLKGQGVDMANKLKDQGLGMANKLKDQGLEMANKMKEQGMEMANKAKEQALEMANKLKKQGMEMANKAKEKAMEAANKMKEQGLEMANKAKEQALEAANKAKEQAMEAANKAKEQGMEAANQAKEQGMAMVGDMQGQMNQQQDKFKKKLKEMLEKGKDYLEVGKEEKDKFMEKGYIEDGKKYMDAALKMTMDGIAFIQAKMMESLSNIAGDMTKQIMTLSEYDTSDIKGLLDDVDPVPVKNFVEEAKPKIGEFMDEMQEMAKKYMEVGIEKAKEAKDEIESEADNAKNDATSLGTNVAGKAQAAGQNMANKAQSVGKGLADKAKKAGMDAANKAKAAGMDAANKAKEAGMKAVDKAKSMGMDAVNKAKSAGMDAVNKAKSMGMDAVNKAKEAGMGALDKAKSLGMGAVGDLKKTGMGALGQAKGLGMGAFGQLKSAGMGALGQLQGIGQGMLGQLSKAGRELLEKAKDKKPSQVKEMKQIQMLQQLKKVKKMQELSKAMELEQDIQWKTFEQLNKEMENELKLEGEGGTDFFTDTDVPSTSSPE